MEYCFDPILGKIGKKMEEPVTKSQSHKGKTDFSITSDKLKNNTGLMLSLCVLIKH